MVNFDDIDKKVLDILQSDGRITNAQLASQIGISPPAMLERVRRLEKTGVIRQYVALMEPEKVGKGILTLVSVSLSIHQLQFIDRFTEEVNRLREVLECYHITGDEDFLLKVAVKDIREYEDFILKKLTRIQGVSKIKTAFILSTVKYNTKLHIDIHTREEGEKNDESF